MATSRVKKAKVKSETHRQSRVYEFKVLIESKKGEIFGEHYIAQIVDDIWSNLEWDTNRHCAVTYIGEEEGGL